MRCGHPLTIAAALLIALVLAGCGGGGGSETTATSKTSAPGVKGERPGREAASAQHLGAADCAALAAAVERSVGVAVKHRAEPSPPLSRCRLTGPGIDVNVYLDAGYAAHQRYENRVVEQAQFGAPDPDKIPHPVSGVGSPPRGANSANWVPAFHSLFAVRGNRWLTVTYAVHGNSESRSRAQAAALARGAFRLSSTG